MTRHSSVNLNTTRSKALVFLALVIVACFFAPSISQATESYQLVSEWGSEGAGDGQFSYPAGIALDSSGNVYVCDMMNNRIQKFTSNGTFITKWGSYGTGDGQFNYPAGITFDSSGNIYVAEAENNRIQKFTSNGTFITKWGTGIGSGDGQFNRPRGIAVDSSGNVYVSERYGDRIQKFTSDGTFITKWGSEGSGDGQFNYPAGIALDSSGNVYVSEKSGDRIQKFTPNGTFITKWGSYGSGDGQFKSPSGIAFDSSGNIYVSEWRRIQKFTPNGTFITKWGSYGQFESLGSIALDSSGNVYVSNTATDRIQKFAKVTSDNTGPTDAYIVIWGGLKYTGTRKVPIRVSAEDIGGTVKYVRFRNASGTWSSWRTYESPQAWELTEGDGFKKVYAQFKDNSGNISSAVYDTITLDTAGPEFGKIEINGGDPYTKYRDVTITLREYRDCVNLSGYPKPPPRCSGVYQVRFRVDGESWGRWRDLRLKYPLTLPPGAGRKRVELQLRDRVKNVRAGFGDSIYYRPKARPASMVVPKVSTKISKTRKFRIKWFASLPNGVASGDPYLVRYRPANSSEWIDWKETSSKSAYFEGDAGRTYHFRVRATGKYGKKYWSKVYSTIVPWNEGAKIHKRSGFNALEKSSKAGWYLNSVRSSYRKGRTIEYKVDGNVIGLVTTKGPNRGGAKIYVDNKHVTTVDAYADEMEPRQLIYYQDLGILGLLHPHYIRIENLGRWPRERFDVDAIVAGRAL